MEHNRLGRTGLQVSRLCLGTMTFGLQCDEPTSVTILDKAAEGGITFIDTADVYTLGGTAETKGRTEEIVEGTLGKSTRPYFRPPLGARDSRVRRVVGDEGFLTVYWTLDSRDSVDRGITADQIRERVLGKAGPGSIVLMHCGSQASADALPGILRGLKERGLTPVTIGRLLQE